MVKIEFFFETRKKRDAVKTFYESLGLRTAVQKKQLRIQSTEKTKIVSATQSRICLRAKDHKEILDQHQDLLYDLETALLEEDVETNHVHRSHHIPFKITLADPLNNSVCITPGLEPKTLGILTSGGDAPGMNSAIWAVVKAGIKNGAKTLGVFSGFEGLIADSVREISEEEAASHMHEGGTFLKSARSKEFCTPEGIAKACATIRKHGINALVVIGGDGTMCGAGALAEACPDLSVVFIPGSIDNDIPGTESIGAATALHKIIESIDCIESTMASHERGFVLEVMGRDCGWLALYAAFATDAAYVFVPEYPQGPSWKEEFKAAVQVQGKMCTYVILAEGAKHKDGSKITGQEICEALEELGVETRQIVLGHTQRGGAPCASDRLIAPTLGVAAAEVALSKPGAYAIYINTTEKIVDLHACIKQCKASKELMSRQEEAGVLKARGKEFVEIYKELQMTTPTAPKETYAVATVGALGAGSEALISNLKKYARFHEKDIRDLSTHPYFQKRSSKSKPADTDISALKTHLSSTACTTLILIGGLDALHEANRLSNVVPSIYVLPCTVSNNVPGTATSIGSDTALDTITALCDNLKINATRNIAYIVEVHGGACGYLSVSTALAMGAIDCYFPEETRILKRLARSVKYLNGYFKKATSPQLIIRGNGAMKGVCIDTAAKILEQDGARTYVVRQCSLGHVQKGNKPTAVDRVRAAKTALYAVKSTLTGAHILGINTWTSTSMPLSSAQVEVNEEKRRVKKAVWLEMARTYRVLN
ncbi:6-phosphofructokinase 1 [Nematocida sp. AWRm77]|nr:6-phosphofructokinase 1 [Nematocida sp. AWRm77]